MTGLLVVLRHGQSSWNDEHRFTGWADPDLAATGRTEATAATGRPPGLRFWRCRRSRNALGTGEVRRCDDDDRSRQVPSAA